MRAALKLHPDSVSLAASTIEVDVSRPTPGALELRYFVTGAIQDLCIPPPSSPERTFGLWEHSCFEAFVRAPSGEPYYELNFAPSSQWAAYRFTGYRSGMSDAIEIPAPRVEVRSSEYSYELKVAVEPGCLRDLPADAPWRLGLSAVIEDRSGQKSYWALAHPPGQPDFHHEDCFALELAPAT